MALTKEQLAIVNHGDGHALVSAVAGSGKTATLVARGISLLGRRVDPRRILVLMFNVSARRDFADRLAQAAAGRYLRLPEVRTFHSLGYKITQACVRRGCLPPRRLVTEEWQLKESARAALALALEDSDMGHKAEQLTAEEVEAFVNFVGLVKSDVVTAADTVHALGVSEGNAHYPAAFSRFEAQRQAAGVRFYADLIYEPVMAMRKDPTIRAWLANHVDHIILDEYQDINESQQQLVKAIAGQRARVMAVGDVDQCVYAWRGARPEFMTERFFEDFPGAARHGLTRTFRYGHRLSLAVNHLIAHNRLRDDHLCLSAEGTPNTRVEHWQEEGDTHPVLPILADWTAASRQLTEAAVLVRLYSMSVPVELALLRKGIPYRLEGHETLFQCAEIRSLLGHLHLASGTLFENPDALAMVETMLAVPQLGFKKQRIREIARSVLDHPAQPHEVLQDLMRNDMSYRQRDRIATRATLWQDLQRQGGRTRAWRVLQQVVRLSDLYDYLRWSSPSPEAAADKVQMCESFLDFAREGNLPVAEFLEMVTHMAAQAEASAKDSRNRDEVLITSIHRAKGLEWPLVILPGLEEGRLPYYLDTEDAVPVEDERRLFYVGCTRAKELLCLIHPADPLLAEHEAQSKEIVPSPAACTASRFLYEARLELAHRVAAALYGGRELDLRGEKPDPAHRYLAAVGASQRLQPAPFRGGNKRRKRRRRAGSPGENSAP